jgi:hypothetical protein
MASKGSSKTTQTPTTIDLNHFAIPYWSLNDAQAQVVSQRGKLGPARKPDRP